MPQLVHRVPQYRLHRASGQAIVTLDSRDHYLGKHGSPASRHEYDRVVAEWLVRGRQATSPETCEAITINQLFVAFWNHVEKYYRKDDQPTGEVQAIRYSLQPVINMYGDSLVTDFGPLRLKAVRDYMINQTLVRRLINHRVHRIRRMFRWGVENALVSPVVLQGLLAVAPLKAGRTSAPESNPIRPLPEDILRKTQEFLSREVSAMAELQWITGMRPGEVVRMRTCDIDQSANVWAYTPESHKTQHHGIKRIVPLGPKAQEIIKPFMQDNKSEAFLFSPVRRIQKWLEERRHQRKSPMTPSQNKRHGKQNPKKKPGPRYTTGSYARAISYACKKAEVTVWGPNRLRHSAATRIRREHGLDAARVILGHRTPVVTEIYAEIDMERAFNIAESSM